MTRTAREILGCQCSHNGTSDGRAYNLKTEDYEDCSCIAQLSSLQQDLLERLPKKKAEIQMTDYLNGVADGRNQALEECRQIIEDYLNEK